MGKNKLKKFADLEQNPLVLQYPFGPLSAEPFSLRGRWGADFFGNDRPIVLELGCGKGEYTVGMASADASRNFIGIDIKGARIWTGATAALRSGMTNVAFLRTSIELLERFFAPGEVAEIWITFPDPQMKKASKRLTGTRMMGVYSHVMAPGGRIHLKTDSPFLYAYTRLMADRNGLVVGLDIADVHGSADGPDYLRDIRTHYEQQWLDRGLTIKYLSFTVPAPDAILAEPPEAAELAPDTYRSYSRGYIQMPQLIADKDTE